MLVIRAKQIQEFIARTDDELADVVREAVRKSNAGRVAGYDDKQLTRMVRIGIDRARARGLFNGEDVAAFVAIMLEIAPRFDDHPQILDVLKDERFAPELRFRQLFQRVPEQAWAEACRLYEDSFWFPDNSAA